MFQKECFQRSYLEFQGYVEGSRGWGETVDKRLGMITRQMQPSLMEWRIQGIAAKLKDLETPMFLRTEVFELAGVPQLKVDWYPNGFYGAAPGSCTLRVYASNSANMRYEALLGMKTAGARHWDAAGKDCLWDEVHFTKGWEQQVRDDALLISLQLLENLADEDGASFGNAVKFNTE